jgi:CRP-like cAMP-binding protein
MAVDPVAADTKCVCSHSLNAHGLRGDPGCSFCSCRRFERPAVAKEDVQLGKYATMAFELLSKDPAFKDIPREGLTTFVQDGRGRMFAPGAPLLSRGDKSHILHIVLSGNVTVQAKDGVSGQQVGAGGIAGDLRAFTDEPRWASVYAADNALALEVDVSKLRPLFAEYPDLFMDLVRLLGKYSESVEEVANATVMAALEQQLVETAEQHHEGLDPDKALEIAARWRKIKEEERDANRAREAAKAAIEAQLRGRPQR